MNSDEKKFEIPLEKRTQVALFINIIRRSKMMSINQLSRDSGVHIYELHRILKSERNKINPFHLIALARVLEINYLWLYQIVGYVNEKKILKEISKALEIFEKIKEDDDGDLGSIKYSIASDDIIDMIDEFEEEGYPEDIRIILGYPEKLGIEYKRKEKIKKIGKEIEKNKKEVKKLEKQLEKQLEKKKLKTEEKEKK